MAEVWKPDPTGRCDLRLEVDAEWTDHVTNGGVALIDPWHIATANRRPVEPWPVGSSYCWRCKRGAVAGEERCSRCGNALKFVAPPEVVAAKRRRSHRRATVAIVAASGLLAAGVWAASRPDTTTAARLEGYAATTACQQAVEVDLRTRSVVFGDHPSVTGSGPSFTVTGVLDHLDANYRFSYRCEMLHLTASQQWQVVSVKVT